MNPVPSPGFWRSRLKQVWAGASPPSTCGGPSPRPLGQDTHIEPSEALACIGGNNVRLAALLLRTVRARAALTIDHYCRWGTLGRVFHRHPLLTLVTGAYLAFVAWLTLTPRPISPDQQRLVMQVVDALHRRGYAESIDYSRFEFLANIALFVPIGVFLLLLFGASGWWLAAIGSVAMTIVIETAQQQIPGRVSDGRDLVANTLGGLIGIVIALILTMPATLRRHRQRTRASDTVRDQV